MKLLAMLLFSISLASGAAFADGVKSKAKDAVDPNCTVGKAAKGAAMKSTVGVGNRCSAAETARDVTGVDGKAKDAKKKVRN
jgi:hypothetical protein